LLLGVREYSENIQGTVREHAENIEAHARNIEAHAGNIQRTFREH
jgi:ActR/RegA family two-component response regulator